MNEEVYKLILLKHFSPLSPTCITLEMPFLAGQRRADVVMVQEDGVHGVEIKSDRDNLDTLSQQIIDYVRVFDYVWLLVSKNHLGAVRNKLPLGVGLMVLEGGQLKVIRKSKKIKRLDKRALTLSLDRASLIEVLTKLNIDHRRIDGVDYLAGKAMVRANTAILRQKFKAQILFKYLPGYETFLRESGKSIHYEDLLNLGLQREIR